MDGLWKLAYPICMAVVEGEVSYDIKEFIPNVCTNTPSYGKAFCEDHCKFVTDLGYQTNLRKSVFSIMGSSFNQSFLDKIIRLTLFCIS